jgi:UDP-N-acetylglucosamine 2-epimerase (non-hydrolysing)
VESVAVVLGTRPEIVKLAPVVRRLGGAAFVVHTGQHFDEEMSGVFFREHGLHDPQVRLTAGSRGRAAQIAHILAGLDELFAARRFEAVVVQGDTNSTLAGALAANAHSIPLVHVEAGLRSHDRAMPEEHNRVVTDHLSDLLCAATDGNLDNLLREGLPAERLALTGNTVVEAVLDRLPDADTRLDLLALHGLRPDRYVLATIHRPENTDSVQTLEAILEELAALPLPVVLPLHPRTSKVARAQGLGPLLDRLQVVGPLGSASFLALAAHCAVLVSDSGGVQEECTVLKRPLVVVRRSTERPEALADFAVRVEPGPGVRRGVLDVLEHHEEVLAHLRTLPSPFGDEMAADRIVDAVVALCARGRDDEDEPVMAVAGGA